MKRLPLIHIYEVNLEIVEIFLSSPSKYKIRTLQSINIKPIVLDGIDFRYTYKDKKYHSGTICKGVTISMTSTLLSA